MIVQISNNLSNFDPMIAAWTIVLGILTSVPCALLGCYLVLRRMSLLGDAISHAVLPGIALGFLITGNLVGPGIVIGAMAVGMLTALLTQTLSQVGHVPEDASMGVVFTSLFAIGVIMITRGARNVDLDPGCVLYGQIDLAAIDTMIFGGLVVPRSFGSLGLATLASLVFIGLLWKELKLVSFDPALATAVGLNATLIHYLLMGMVAGVTVAAFEAVGAILVVAMLIVPGATAHQLTDRLHWMMMISVIVAVIASVFGYFGAVALNSSVAGMMAVVAGLQFGLAVIFAPKRGLVSQAVQTLALSLRIAREDVLARLYRAEETETSKPLGVAWSTCRQWASTVAGNLAGAWAVRQLVRWGWARPTEAGRCGLTETGRQQALSLVRAHRLWESYLSTHFHLPPDHLHEPAERIEHYLGPELQADLATDLERPAADPHGRSIPNDQENNG